MATEHLGAPATAGNELTRVDDISELAQDAVGGILSNSSRINLTYSDATPSITADIVSGSIGAAQLANMPAATIKGRAAGGGAGDPQDLVASQVKTILGYAASEVAFSPTGSLASTNVQDAIAELDTAVSNRFIYAVKASAETVTSSTTLQNDNELFLTLTAPGFYRVEAFLTVSGAQAGDVKTAWLRTGNLPIVGNRSVFGPQSGTTNILNTAARISSGHAGATEVLFGTDASLSSLIYESMILQAVATGVLTLQWAQATSSATATTMAQGSYIVATRIG